MPGTTNKVEDPCQACRGQSTILQLLLAFPTQPLTNLNLLRSSSKMSVPCPFSLALYIVHATSHLPTTPSARQYNACSTGDRYDIRHNASATSPSEKWLTLLKATTIDRDAHNAIALVRNAVAPKASPNSVTVQALIMRGSSRKIKYG